MNEEHREHRRKDDKPWWKDGRFLVPMLVTVAMSLTGAFFGSWVASSNRLAALDEIAKNLQRSVAELREQIGSTTGTVQNLSITTSNAITAQAGDIRRLSEEQRRELDFIRDQNAYNFNINKVVTEMATTLRLHGLPAPTIPEPPRLGGK